MGTSIRAELSKKNRWWISKHRYYELKHFCLQYREWEKEYRELSFMVSGDISRNDLSGVKNTSYRDRDNTGEIASKMAELSRNIEMVKRMCGEADVMLSEYIFRAVVNGETYSKMQAGERIPCCQDVFYDRYHKFFWLLDKER